VSQEVQIVMLRRALDILVRAVNVRELDPLAVFVAIEQARHALQQTGGEG